jgi:hypothetical protein
MRFVLSFFFPVQYDGSIAYVASRRPTNSVAHSSISTTMSLLISSQNPGMMLLFTRDPTTNTMQSQWRSKHGMPPGGHNPSLPKFCMVEDFSEIEIATGVLGFAATLSAVIPAASPTHRLPSSCWSSSSLCHSGFARVGAVGRGRCRGSYWGSFR